MMKTFLFLDDSHERIKTARKQYSNYDLHIVERAMPCIKKLDKAWDIVSLDHDLGGEVFVDSDREDTGMEVVRWIIKNKPKIDLVIVHSWNVPAARTMDIKLREAGYRVERRMFGFT